MEKLSDRSRGMIQDRIGDGPDQRPLTVSEIARREGMSVSQACRHIHRAIRRMHHYAEEEGIEWEP